MAIIDEHGRLFRRWNLLDLALLVLIIGLIPLGYAAYLLFREQPPAVVSVTPNQMAPASEFRLTIKGENLRPYMRVSAGIYQGRDFYFKTTEEAEVPFAYVPPGVYDIVLFDQAQERVRLPKALTITPAGLPATRLIAVGAFGNLDAAGAAKLVAGTELANAGRIVSVGRPAPDQTKVFSGSTVVGVQIPNALRLPAIVQFDCHVRAPQGSPACLIDDTVVAAPALMTLSTPLGKTPFQVEQVRSPIPQETVPVDVRLVGETSLLALVKPGDTDLNGTANEFAMLARVESAGEVRASGERQVRLAAQLQKTAAGWLYNSAVLRVGSTFYFRTATYEVSGIVTGLPPLTVSSR
jgi:hypothetical protein